MDKYGQDILLDEALRPVMASNGDMQLTVGPQTVMQDIRLLLWSGSDGLFYDTNWRSYVLDFVQSEDLYANRLALCVEVVRRIHMHPMVVVGSALCRVENWDELTVILSAEFKLVGEDYLYNLVITMDNNRKEMVIKDVNPY